MLGQQLLRKKLLRCNNINLQICSVHKMTCRSIFITVQLKITQKCRCKKSKRTRADFCFRHQKTLTHVAATCGGTTSSSEGAPVVSSASLASMRSLSRCRCCCRCSSSSAHQAATRYAKYYLTNLRSALKCVMQTSKSTP